MASGQIRMTPDTMRGRAGEYRTEAENVQNVIDKMDRLQRDFSRQISCSWQPVRQWERQPSCST